MTILALLYHVASCDPESFQRLSMFKLIGGDEPKEDYGRQLKPSLNSDGVIYDERKDLSVCDWRLVRCVEEKVISIEWNVRGKECAFLATLDLQWVPNTIQEFHVSHQTRAVKLSQFSTRYLPRDLKSLVLKDLGVYGELDLQSLPKDIVRLDVSVNCLHGTVLLMSLPQRLQYIDARCNTFQRVVVDNKRLTDEFRGALLWSQRIVPVTEVSRRKLDKRINTTQASGW